MNRLNRKAIGGLLQFLVILFGLLFLPAGSLDYWQAWIFLAVFFGSALAITLYVMRHDPQLLARRLRAGPAAEKETRQKIIQSLASVVFVAAVVVSALDHRFGWSGVPWPVIIGGDLLIIAGFIIVFLVFRENSFASATIEVAPGQRVVSTGPYAVVRHPMYAGALIMFVGIPLSLGSWWGLLSVVPVTAVLIWRLLDEEALLARDLPDYAEYRTRVKYRLIPTIW